MKLDRRFNYLWMAVTLLIVVAVPARSQSCIGQPLDKVPRSVTIITREEILQQTAGTRNLNQILFRRVPGYRAATGSHRAGRISLRGRQPAVLLDGVPVAMNPNSIDPSSVERIEVIPQASDRCIF